MNKALIAAAVVATSSVFANTYYPSPSGNMPSQSTSAPASYNTYQKNQVAKPANGTVVEAAASEPSTSTFNSAIIATDLNDVLSRPGPYTIFAPNNEAFKKLSPETWANLMRPENKEKLKEIIKNHVIPGKFIAADVKTATLYSLDGKPLEIKVNGKEITVNGVKVIRTDIVGTNGVIHIIDTVLVPKK